jgi:dihydrofolate reductase
MTWPGLKCAADCASFTTDRRLGESRRDGMLATALEELRLIDEYRIVVHPVVTGRGPTLFHGLSNARHLELLSTQRFESGVQALHLRRKAE